ncbi:gamma-glutamyl-gamma-aminobutyrate hydrolase family protein [Sporosarcina sp. ACRSL]|uniref:gamma-glutamyl-gamma-aminobutyrate hydrolase family protein n=1 Tax=Sporosarcina sp. ACRSL TaxID=2918215 RepID=UPI001EF72E30|nr:gamma-glutamyl-gamma-aminobutyrate hydrolase family protein [Sporosarcina sp. ACRSL]MCG7343353.1 gamma-glutamyl-gamma-aminobutyrate hydrolase family protein [Sporosarcina sp. ACRSL]
MKPVIGITSNIDATSHTLQNTYIQAVIAGGGLPIIIPTGVERDVQQLTSLLDGLIISGGGDMNPLLFNEEPLQQLGSVTPERDTNELTLVKHMLALDKPILGICRGHQVLNVAFGGTLYQDIISQSATPLLQHDQKAKREHPTHSVHIEKGTILESIANAEKILVNSFHHQALKDIPSPLIVSGRASDGIVEAVESTDHRFVVGVQWHPEALRQSDDQVSIRLFDAYLKACQERMVAIGYH